ncbi:MAG: radical SAM protein [Lentisphaerae bacterium]|nr:radical SAM protein [Lentisphaerota bacterium]
MRNKFIALQSLPDFSLWAKTEVKRIPFEFDLEVTARCNNACRHCCLNLPADDSAARRSELSLAEISDIAGQAVALGALWCLITGGEPLLRKDFFDLYLCLKRKGLLVSVFTNACLVSEKHIRLFRQYPPRDIEVTVYGVTKETYERITRRRGSFAAFRRGLDLLLASGIKVRLKAMALRSNQAELAAIAGFCRAHTKDFFRFDPFLHLRFDGNRKRNAEIRAERLSPAAVAAVEQADEQRAAVVAKECDTLIAPHRDDEPVNCLFHCGAGHASFAVSANGLFRLCPSLWHPDCLYDLRQGTLAEAWQRLVPQVLALCSTNEQFLKKCCVCPLLDLCMWCPAHAYLEHGQMDGWCRYFCEVAHQRVAAAGGKQARVHK